MEHIKAFPSLVVLLNLSLCTCDSARDMLAEGRSFTGG
jgi:hypothetical protein